MTIVKELDIRASYCIFYHHPVGVLLHVAINFLFSADKESSDTELPFYKYLIVGAGTSSVSAYRAIKARDPKAKVNESKY